MAETGPTPAAWTALANIRQNVSTGSQGWQVGHPTSPEALGSGTPSQYIPGTAAGASPDAYGTASRRVYPVFDGLTDATKLTSLRPANFPETFPTDNTAPDGFHLWHSSHQAEFIKGVTEARIAAMGDAAWAALTDGERNFLSVARIGASDTAPPTAAYFLTDRGVAINLMALTRSDLAMLSPDDQAKIIAMDGHRSGDAGGFGLLERLGLTPKSDTTVLKLVTDAIAELKAAVEPTTSSETRLPSDDWPVFLQQIERLEQRLNAASAFSKDTFDTALSEIGKRYERALEFYAARDRKTTSFSGSDAIKITSGVSIPVITTASVTQVEGIINTDDRPDNERQEFKATGDPGLVFGAFSTDLGASVASGYDAFMRSERIIASQQARRDAIASASDFTDPKKDVAYLIFQLQQLYEGELEAVAESETEVIRQLHALLQDYAIMQQLVSKQQGFYDPSASGETRRFMNVGSHLALDGKEKVDRAQVIEDSDPKEDSSDAASKFLTAADGTFSEFYIQGSSQKVVNRNDVTSADDFDRIVNSGNIPRFHWSLLAKDGSSPLYNEAYEWATGFGDIITTNASFRDNWSQNGLNQQEFAAMSMFLGADFMPQNNRHPLEKLFNAPTRPTFDIIDTTNDRADDGLSLKNKAYWDSASSQLAEMVTLLNQQNQLRQAEIENAQKQANRHFELGNNALRKMNDLLMSIGRI